MVTHLLIHNMHGSSEEGRGLPTPLKKLKSFNFKSTRPIIADKNIAPSLTPSPLLPRNVLFNVYMQDHTLIHSM